MWATYDELYVQKGKVFSTKFSRDQDNFSNYSQTWVTPIAKDSRKYLYNTDTFATHTSLE